MLKNRCKKLLVFLINYLKTIITSWKLKINAHECKKIFFFIIQVKTFFFIIQVKTFFFIIQVKTFFFTILWWFYLLFKIYLTQFWQGKKVVHFILPTPMTTNPPPALFLKNILELEQWVLVSFNFIYTIAFNKLCIHLFVMLDSNIFHFHLQQILHPPPFHIFNKIFWKYSLSSHMFYISYLYMIHQCIYT
jgi:hypothetical protein